MTGHTEKAGRSACVLAELPAEVGLGVETDCLTDVRDAELRQTEQADGVFHAHLQNIFCQRQSKLLPEPAGQVGAAVSDPGGDEVCGQFLIVTRVYIAHTLTDGRRERGGLPVGMDSVDEIIDHTIVDPVELIDMCGVGNFLPVAADEICRGSRWESPIRGGA